MEAAKAQNWAVETKGKTAVGVPEQSKCGDPYQQQHI
jgi:hypothetical protein